ncbi:hypothetical protein, partial [Bradyrhizobium sp.]|uniref:hypothetical protein n=1 Tax=Bradyrhizobium sp. TaxID=376 RepID=UPI003C74CD30
IQESQNEARRLTSAVDTLNGDRDRLYSRVTMLEQGLDSVTGAVARQTTATASPPPVPAPATTAQPQQPPQDQAPAPVVAAVATIRTAAASPEKPPAAEKPHTPAAAEPTPATTASVSQDATKAAVATPATPLVASKSMMAPPDPAAGKLIEPVKPASSVVATATPVALSAANEVEADEASAPKAAIQRTEFGVDLGSANSLSGLRALWRGHLKSRSNAALTTLRPIIVVREGSNGLGMQLRLVAGPLNDAGAAARICAVLAENDRACETTIFDGQRLTMKADDSPPAPGNLSPRRRGAKRAAVVVEEPPKKPEGLTLSSLFGRKGQ